MTDSDKTKGSADADVVLPAGSSGPLVFISHDGRDADLAEAFSKLLKSVSAGMIKTFRSSDKKGSDGIDFGDEWYKRLMTKLQSTSDVVCLFTDRSLDRVWISLGSRASGDFLPVGACEVSPESRETIALMHGA